MRIIIASSGTGGHLFCGLAVAEELEKEIRQNKLFFLGSNHELARRIIEAKGFKYYKIYSAGLTGKGVINIAKFILGQAICFLQSGLLLLLLKPNVVFSAGGFASMGVVLWGRICRIPCVIHEQNILPGKVNLLASRLVNKVLLSFNETRKYFDNKKCIFTGMPVRFKEKISAEEARRRLSLEPGLFTMLIMGGSSGAHKINKLIVDIIERLPKDIQYIHLTGREDLDYVQSVYKKHGCSAYVDAFSAQMDVIYSASNMVICRAGSGTLSEISFFGLPSILIPYPYSKDRHQYKNADFAVREGAALVVYEENMSVDKIIGLVKDRNRLEKMAENSARLARPDAAENIVSVIMESVHA